MHPKALHYQSTPDFTFYTSVKHFRNGNTEKTSITVVLLQVLVFPLLLRDLIKPTVIPAMANSLLCSGWEGGLVGGWLEQRIYL